MPNENPQRRTQADKDRSRQQSRAVSGKEAAKGVAGKPGQGQRQTSGGRPQQGAKGPRPPGAGPGRGGGRRPPAKGPAGRRGAPKPRGSRTALFTWAAIGLVVIVVGVLVIVKVSSGTSTGHGFNSSALPASTTRELTSVPESVFNTVGVTSTTIAVAVPHPTAGQKALVIDKKPGFFYLGGEFCPYCAAERWAIAASLGRFGTFTGIKTMESSTSDVYPNTHTITFATATYKSPYIGAELLEESSRTHGRLRTPTTSEQKLVTKYDVAKYTGGSSTASGSIPFIDVGNKVLTGGASYVPSALSPGTTPLTWADIAGGLNDPSNPVTKAIISTANYLSASVCSIDGGKPASVCKGKGVTEAAKAMGLKL
jgi:hypothetical protein